jgi:hypothetical protein
MNNPTHKDKNMIRKGMKFNTGNYHITVGSKERLGDRELIVEYIGPHAAGVKVSCGWDERTEIELWGDFDVEMLLQEYEYDRYTNKLR